MRIACRAHAKCMQSACISWCLRRCKVRAAGVSLACGAALEGAAAAAFACAAAPHSSSNTEELSCCSAAAQRCKPSGFLLLLMLLLLLLLLLTGAAARMPAASVQRKQTKHQQANSSSTYLSVSACCLSLSPCLSLFFSVFFVYFRLLLSPFAFVCLTISLSVSA